MRGLTIEKSVSGLARGTLRGGITTLRNHVLKQNQTMNTNNPIAKKLILSLAAALASVWATSSNPAISVGAVGSGTLTFNAFPTVADGWSTLSIGTSSATITTPDQLDAAVELLSAGQVNMPLGQSATVSPAPSANVIARWNSVLLLLQTRPTTVDYNVLMATLQNNTGSSATTLAISYDLGALVASDSTIMEDIPGHRVYYSLTGDAGTWVHIPDLDSPSAASAGPKSATVDLSATPWAAGATLYVLWADDNGPVSDTAPTREGAYTIDNAIFSTHTIAAMAPMIVTQPASTNVNERQVARLNVTATGTGPLTYQWYKGNPPSGTAVAGAISDIFFVTNTAGGREGLALTKYSGPH